MQSVMLLAIVRSPHTVLAAVVSSAASLLICTPDLYDDHSFLAALGEAVASLPVGSALDPKHIITPLIRPPSEALARGLQDLPSGSTWLLRPEIAKDNPRLVRPGVKVGVQAGTFDHQTEFFGPLLGVMRADNLTHLLSIDMDELLFLPQGRKAFARFISPELSKPSRICV